MTMAQAIAGALRGNEESRHIGFADGMSGAPWCCPAGADMLAYSLGHADGKTERLCGGGERHLGMYRAIAGLL